MLRIHESTHPADAKRYYTTSLASSDYYMADRTEPGSWGGKGATELGLSGAVTRESFAALCDNLLPDATGPLTSRTKAKRRVGYDFTFCCPKSLAVVHALTGDDALRTAVIEAVSETMELIETEAKCRVRRAGACEDRITGNLVWATFLHETTRPIDGVPDPFTHGHVFAFNATYDPGEQRWKAAQFGDVIRSAPFFEAYFHASLSGKVATLGYGVERRGLFWEISAVPRSVIDKFSGRTAEIERAAKRLGITDAKAKDALGARTRRRKNESLPWASVLADWRRRISPAEQQAISNAKTSGQGQRVPSAREAVEYGLAVALERSSVADERRVIEHALRFGVGGVSVEAAREELARLGVVVRKDDGGKVLVSAKTILEQETRMLSLARQGRGTCKGLNPEGTGVGGPGLTERQRAALSQMLKSPDRVILFGLANEGVRPRDAAIAGIQAGGHCVTVLDARAVGDVRPDEVHRIIREARERTSQGGVIWVNNAERLGVGTLANLFQLNEELGGRVVLSGRPRRKGPVELRGALDTLERLAGLGAGLVERGLQRRSETQSAVKAARQGQARKALSGLDRLGDVREVGRGELAAAVAREYAKATRRQKKASIRVDGDAGKFTQAVRKELHAKRLLGRSRRVPRLTRVGLSERQRKEATRYKRGQIVVFYKSVKGFKAGHRYKVMGRDPFGNVLAHETAYNPRDSIGQRMAVGKKMLNRLWFEALPLSKSEFFNVYKQDTIELARGDRIRITASGKTFNERFGIEKLLSKRRQAIRRENYKLLDKYVGIKMPDRRYRVRKDSTYRVKRITLSGNIKLDNGWVLPRGFGHLDYGYCAAEQEADRSVKHLIIVPGERHSFRFGREDVPKGVESVVVFTESKERLFKSVPPSSRPAAGQKTTGGEGREAEHGRPKSEGREQGR